MNQTERKLKVLIGQINPIYREVQKNIDRILTSVKKYSPADQIDLFVLPEMALTGYIFKSREEIEPFLEDPSNGVTNEFCRKLALQMNCYVICGYPEKGFYNSAMVLDRTGQLIENHRKKILYDADKPWCNGGNCFKNITLKNTKNQDIVLTIAICMDINYVDFKDSSQFELAWHCKESKSDGVVLICCWNDHEPKNDNPYGIMDYWIWRLNPIKNEKTEKKYDKQFVFICADRVGTEENTIYMGASCVIKMNPIQLVGNLGKKAEGYLVSELTLANLK